MKASSAAKVKRAREPKKILAVLAAVTLLGPQFVTQGAPVGRQHAAGGAVSAASVSDLSALADAIREIDSPAFRAYLYSRATALFWKKAGDDQALKAAAAGVAVRAVADIHRHESDIAPAPAFDFYEELLDVIRRHSPEEAARAEHAYPLQSKVNRAAQVKAGAELHEVLTGAGESQAVGRGLEQALRLIDSGAVPVMSLHKELLLQDRLNSSSLPHLLSAALALEERAPGTIPLQNLFFLSHLYLRERTPPELRARFLVTVVRVTSLTQDQLRADPGAGGSAIRLLQASLPHIQAQTPSLYAEAAARMASLSGGRPTESEVFSRIRASADPLARTMEEAASASDRQLKRELLEAAARMAREQGKLRHAVELILSADEGREDGGGADSKRDEFLYRIAQDALAQSEVETAVFAASAVKTPLYRAGVALGLARHYTKVKDAQAAATTLDEAAGALDAMPDGKEKAAAYFRLAATCAEVDSTRAHEMLREAVKAANRISRSRDESPSKFSFSLFPLAEAVTSAFRRLAADRASASGTAAAFQMKELKTAAMLGVYSVAGQ